MAWRCSASSNAQLVANLRRAKIINTDAVEQAMAAVDRGCYCVAGDLSPYADKPASIGFGVTISAPHMHAYALEMLAGHLREGMRALDVGSGSGYLAACMAVMCGAGGHVYGIDHIEELVERSTESVKRDTPDLLESGRLNLRAVDGFDGLPDHAPFNAIHVGAAAPDIPPALIDQLSPGGRMVIPVGPENGDQYIMQVDKADDGSVTMERVMGVRYVPLTTREHQLGHYK